MSHTEKQARDKICPNMGGENCVASDCMGWRWSRARETKSYLDAVQARMKEAGENFNIASQRVYADIGSTFEKVEGYCGQFANCHPSSKAEWNNLRFPRTRTDSQWVEMERTSIPEPWVSVILNWLGLLAFFVAVWMVC